MWMEDSGPPSVTVFYHSITTWGPQAQGHLQKIAGGKAVCGDDHARDLQFVGALAYAEHHVGTSGTHKYKSDHKNVGFRIQASCATPSGHSVSGTHGGVSLAIRSRIQQQALASSPQDPLHHWRPVGVGHDRAAQTVRLRGQTVLLIVIYLTCNLGHGGENLDKLFAVQTLVQELGLQAVILVTSMRFRR